MENIIGRMGKKSSFTEINYLKLKEPLQKSDSVSRLVCSKCGTIGEIDLSYAIDLMKVINILEGKQSESQAALAIYSIPNYFSKKYFYTAFCDACSKVDSQDFWIVLKKI